MRPPRDLADIRENLVEQTIAAVGLPDFDPLTEHVLWAWRVLFGVETRNGLPMDAAEMEREEAERRG